MIFKSIFLILLFCFIQIVYSGGPGSLEVFGSNNEGQLGLGTVLSGTSVNEPTELDYFIELANEEIIRSIDLGSSHSIYCTLSGKVFVSGSNNEGELGLGDNQQRDTPFIVTSELDSKKCISVSAGTDFSIVLTSDNEIYSFGVANFGQTGQDSTSSSNLPTLIQPATGTPKFQTISSGSAHTIALDENGFLWSWGKQGTNGLASNADVPTRVDSAGTTVFTSISAGGEHNLLISENKLFTFGSNTRNQIHIGLQTASRFKATQYDGYTGDVEAIAAGNQHSMFLTSSGQVYSFGDNTYSQTAHNASAPFIVSATLITSLTDIITIAAGGDHSIALDSSGQLYSWGRGDSYQTGQETLASLPVPTVLNPADTSSPIDPNLIRLGDSASVFYHSACSSGCENCVGIETCECLFGWRGSTCSWAGFEPMIVIGAGVGLVGGVCILSWCLIAISRSDRGAYDEPRGRRSGKKGRSSKRGRSGKKRSRRSSRYADDSDDDSSDSSDEEALRSRSSSKASKKLQRKLSKMDEKAKQLQSEIEDLKSQKTNSSKSGGSGSGSGSGFRNGIPVRQQSISRLSHVTGLTDTSQSNLTISSDSSSIHLTGSPMESPNITPQSSATNLYKPPPMSALARQRSESTLTNSTSSSSHTKGSKGSANSKRSEVPRNNDFSATKVTLYMDQDAKEDLASVGITSTAAPNFDAISMGMSDMSSDNRSVLPDFLRAAPLIPDDMLTQSTAANGRGEEAGGGIGSIPISQYNGAAGSGPSVMTIEDQPKTPTGRTPYTMRRKQSKQAQNKKKSGRKISRQDDLASVQNITQ